MIDHLEPLRAAYVMQKQRAYRQYTRGIPAPEHRRAWEAEADAMIAEHDREVAARAWDEAVRACVYEDGTPVEVTANNNPYRSGGHP